MGKKKIRFLENKNYLKLLTLLALLFLVLILKNNNLQNLVLIFLGFYLVVILSPKETRVIILVAFTLRLILLLVNSYLFTLPEVIGSDAGMFEATALNWSQNGLAWLFNNFTSGAFLYSWFIAVFYVIFGHNPFLIEFINVIFGTFTVLGVYLICGEIFSRKEALISAFITSIFPSLVYFSVVMLREAPAVFFFTYGTYLLLKWFKEGYVGYLIASECMFMLSIGLHTGYIVCLFAVLVLALIVLLKALTNNEIKIKLLFDKFISFVTSLFFIWLEFKTRFGFEKISALFPSSPPHSPSPPPSSPPHSPSPPPSSPPHSPSPPPSSTTNIPNLAKGLFQLINDLVIRVVNYIYSMQSAYSFGRAVYLQNLKTRSFFDLFYQAPIRLFYFMFAPFPWMIRNSLDLLGFVDSLFYIVLVTLILLNLKKIFRNKNALIILFLILGELIVFSLITSNYGAALRHRAKFVPMLIILASPSISTFINNLEVKLKNESSSRY